MQRRSRDRIRIRGMNIPGPVLAVIRILRSFTVLGIIVVGTILVGTITVGILLVGIVLVGIVLVGIIIVVSICVHVCVICLSTFLFHLFVVRFWLVLHSSARLVSVAV
jgi:hypothetical protein